MTQHRRIHKLHRSFGAPRANRGTAGRQSFERPAGRLPNVTPAVTAGPAESFIISRETRQERLFRELVTWWNKETWFISSVKKRVAHEAYLQIIGMGEAAIPLLLRELLHEPDHWFVALQATTRHDPTTPRSDFEE